MKKTIIWVVSIFVTMSVKASHIRAGEIITFKTGQFQYRFIFVLFRDKTGVEQDEVTFKFGDGESVEVRRGTTTDVGNGTERYTFEASHTYAGPGEYTASVEVFARNPGILNVPNSSQTAFYVESNITIDPFIGPNTSPQLLAPPIDIGYKNKIFFHNPAAWDAEGDSLSFEIIVPLVEKNTTVPGYTTPQSFGGKSNSGGVSTFAFDNRTGQMVWNTPPRTGLFNVAFKVNEYRDGVLIGYVMRDMQIIIKDDNSLPPTIIVPKDTCIVAGKILQNTITGLDSSFRAVNIYGYNGSYHLTTGASVLSCVGCVGNSKTESEYKFLYSSSPAKAIFYWNIGCENIRSEPYNFVFKAENNLDSPNKMVDIKPWMVRVSAPPILGFNVSPQNKSMVLRWQKYACNNASNMLIYRRKCRPDTLFVDSCITGREFGANFEKIAEIKATDTMYVDNNNGAGLSRASLYCYMIYATFPLPAKGYGKPSKSQCATLDTQVPVILNASVVLTSTSTGQNLVRWSKPSILNTTAGVTYRYELYRMVRNTKNKIFETNDVSVTTFTDSNLNTAQNTYKYFVHFYNLSQNISETTDTASTVFLTHSAKPNEVRLSWKFDTPWNNSVAHHYIYRKLADSAIFRLIDSVMVSGSEGNYFDKGTFKNRPLQKNKSYQYYVTTQGRYQCERKDTVQLSLPSLLSNHSNVISVIIPDKDTLKPCTPTLFISKINCDSLDNLKAKIYWQPSNNFLCDETNYYVIYNAPDIDDTFVEIASSSKLVTTYTRTDQPISGCFYVVARNAINNESKPSNIVCVPKINCLSYELPNVFTPNGDGLNDVFRPMAGARAVSNVNISIYNRWGNKVHQSTESVSIDWDGSNLPDGIYYYHAVIVYQSEEGTKNKILNGWVQLIR